MDERRLGRINVPTLEGLLCPERVQQRPRRGGAANHDEEEQTERHSVRARFDQLTR